MEKPISANARTLAILKHYGMSAKKGFGQNFIIDPSVVEKIARVSGINETTNVIEVGPGIGALTEQLALKAKSVTAYEIDPRCIEVLADTMSPYPNVNVILKDFLEVKADELPEGELTLCANLPYYVTTPILFHILENLPKITSFTIMVQKEVADRFVAKPSTKDYNALSIIVQTLYEVKNVMNVPKGVFLPRPNVDSAVVRFVRRTVLSVDDPDRFFKLVKTSFTQRRKTLANNLKELGNQEKIQSSILKAGLSESVRAEALTLAEFVKLYEVWYENESVR
ncbi:MAG: 16S rRNA (adenine(1518)-N(6)/adenine(1519)-N(6))-dimethyltransferase RsmA [Erysipelotrichaceae bacterium]|nr:16S rRNA (adenine(1518)-N(6)/adenine(1519)-N(6))-dimethyltransferase RsmA [Erysipelotrichaceae bacterium]